jgi:hypothetical protein
MTKSQAIQRRDRCQSEWISAEVVKPRRRIAHHPFLRQRNDVQLSNMLGDGDLALEPKSTNG